MRFGLVIFCTAIFLTACSSESKKQDSKSTTEKPSATPTKTEAQTPLPEKSADPQLKVTCSVSGDERILVVRKQGSGCELIYTKGGKDGIIASSVNGTGHCEATQSKIKDRLSGSGFKCQ